MGPLLCNHHFYKGLATHTRTQEYEVTVMIVCLVCTLGMVIYGAWPLALVFRYERQRRAVCCSDGVAVCCIDGVACERLQQHVVSG